MYYNIYFIVFPLQNGKILDEDSIYTPIIQDKKHFSHFLAKIEAHNFSLFR
jgi:hypothetical protein